MVYLILLKGYELMKRYKHSARLRKILFDDSFTDLKLFDGNESNFYGDL